jgi:hypothetical protein
MKKIIEATVIRNRSLARPRAKVCYTGVANAQQVERIVACWSASSTREHDSAWYWRARTYCENLAHKYNTTVETVAGILAALSPGCPYERNMKDAEATVATWCGMVGNFDGHKCATYRRNVAKAIAICEGAHVEYTLAPKPRRSGMKCLAFYRAIMEPWRADSVVVDRHALALAHGRKYTKGVTYRRYQDFARSYKIAAYKVKVGVNELQAATWCHWRKEKVK